MATPQDVTNLTTILQEILTLSASGLARSELGPFLSFETGQPEFDRIRNLATRLIGADLSMLGPSQVSNLTSYSTTIRDYLKQIASFAPAGSNPTPQERDSHLNNLRGSYDTFASAAADALSIGSRPDLDLSAVRQRAEQAVTEIRQLVDETRAVQEKAASDAKQTASSLQAAAGAGGVARHEKLFDDEAKVHKENAKSWLVATAGLAIATFVYSLLMLTFGGLPPEASTAIGIQHSVAAVLVFTVLASAVIWSGRIYRAHQHNYIINRHRQIALTTFETFAKAAGDDLETKNAVLRLATEAVFVPQQTGYVTQEQDPSPGSAQILEIVRNIGK